MQNDTPPPSQAQEKTRQAAQKAGELGLRACAEVKDAAVTASKAILALLADPVTGQSAAISSLGPRGVLQSGIVFAAIFLLSVFISAFFGANTFLGALTGVMYAFGDMDGNFRLRMVGGALVRAAVTGAALLLCVWSAARLFGTRKLTWAETLFTTGICLAPMSAASLLMSLFAALNLFNVILGLLLVAFTLLVLLLNASLTTLAGITPRLGFVLTPLVLLVTGLIVSFIR